MSLKADVLAKILILQSMLRQFPSREQLFDFLCRGLQEVPGVAGARCAEGGAHNQEGQHGDSYYFPLHAGGGSHGSLILEISDEAEFEPYAIYVHNLGVMIAVIMEERRLSGMMIDYQKDLERQVDERTRELQEEMEVRRLAEQQALEQRDRAEQYLEVSEAVIVELDCDGKVAIMNKRGFDLMNYTADEVLGRDWFDLAIPENQRAMVKNVFERVMAGELEPVEYFENEIMTKAGDHLHIAWHNSLRRDCEGRILSSVSSGIDMTAHKRAEEALSAETERLAVTLRSIGDGVITTDVDGRVVIMNRIAEFLTGWHHDEAIGCPIEQVLKLAVYEGGEEVSLDPTKRILSQGEVIELGEHTTLISKDGTRRIISDSGAPIRDRNSEIVGVVLVFRDMTEKMKLLEEVQRSDKLESVGVLAGGIAHDFNNLLSGIFGHLEIARLKCPAGSDVVEHLDRALSVYDRATSLTKQLLTFAKGGAPIRKVGSVADLLEESVTFALAGSNVRCEYDFPRDLWLAEFDENQMAQVIDNLTINAKQAMPEGGSIHVVAENVELQEGKAILSPGKYVRIRFIDHGKGISPEHLGRIFDPFFTTKEQGNGLGLATCYSIVQQHDGSIEVTSVIGEGTTFMLYLPASGEELALVAEKESAATQVCVGLILVLDDEDFIREVLGDLLREDGYEVIEAATAEDAIEACRSVVRDGRVMSAMILDLTIPGGRGGKEIIHELLDICPGVPIFASSGYSAGAVMARPQEYGFTAAIHKPYRKAQLDRLLQRYL